MAQNDKNVVTEDKVTFRLCDDCLGVNLKTLIPKLKKKAPNAEFIIGCQSYCGPGRTQTFTLVNSRICIADTEVELMPLVDEKLRKLSFFLYFFIIKQKNLLILQIIYV